jgi:hypothetical protein
VGALVFVALATAALGGAISQNWLASEDRWRPDLITGIPRHRLYTCGLVRALPLLGNAVSVVPCQFWNLMPLTGLGVLSAGWLILDLARGKR